MAVARKTAPQRRPSGPGPARFLLRLPATLHRVLSERARADGVSLNEYCVRRLRAAEPPLGFPIDVAALVDRVREVVADEQIVGLIVHGSMARGDASTSSDIDVLIVVDRDVALTRELYRRWDAGHTAPSERSLDAHFVHLPQSTERAGSVWCEAAIEGVVVTDPRGRVWRALLEVRRAISEGKLVRRQAHGQPYWTAA